MWVTEHLYSYFFLSEFVSIPAVVHWSTWTRCAAWKKSTAVWILIFTIANVEHVTELMPYHHVSEFIAVVHIALDSSLVHRARTFHHFCARFATQAICFWAVNFSVHLDHHHHHRFRLGEFAIVFRSCIKLQRSTKMFKQELQVFFALACVFVWLTRKKQHWKKKRTRNDHRCFANVQTSSRIIFTHKYRRTNEIHLFFPSFACTGTLVSTGVCVSRRADS